MREFEFPSITNEKVRKAADEFTRLRAETAAADRAVADLEAHRPEVVAEDRQRLAEAIRAGEKEPAATGIEQHEARIADARRRAEAVAVAVDEAERELVAVIESERPRWAVDLDKAVARDRAAVLKAIDALADAVASLSDSLAAASWLSRFPHRPILLPPAITATVPGLTGVNRDAYPVSVVLDALRSLGRPPVPVEPPPILHVAPPPRRRASARG